MVSAHKPANYQATLNTCAECLNILKLIKLELGLYLLMYGLRIDCHLAAAVLYLVLVLLSIMTSPFFGKSFVKSIGVVVKVNDFVAKSVNQHEDDDCMLVWHVHIVANKIHEKCWRDVESILTHHERLVAVVRAASLVSGQRRQMQR